MSFYIYISVIIVTLAIEYLPKLLIIIIEDPSIKWLAREIAWPIVRDIVWPVFLLYMNGGPNLIEVEAANIDIPEPIIEVVDEIISDLSNVD